MPETDGGDIFDGREQIAYDEMIKKSCCRPERTDCRAGRECKEMQTEVEMEKIAADNGQVVKELPTGEVSISVRNLVEFILRSGDIDNRRQKGAEGAMQEGSRIHRMLQRKMGAEYKAEVFLRYTQLTPKYCLVVEGRADGIIEADGETTIDEIKGTYRDLERLTAPVPVHLAQAKCYAYMYACQKELSWIRVRLTYCNIETEDIRYFFEEYSFAELEEWFGELLAAYRRWADYSYAWREERQKSIELLQFPFPYREGQRELVSYVYQTIYHKRKLFLEAPTGVGKTISTIFPAVKAMGKEMGDKLFYLTAKTITGTVADDTIALLRTGGLRMKSIVLTAKEKICFMEETDCNPEKCPYARGHFDRVNEAIYQLITADERFSREKLEEYALRYQVCPFELALDVSLFADAVICDYNYLFDPHVYLKRFFGDGASTNYLFLIDEAHNLLERGREMYSAVIVREELLELKRELKQTITAELSRISDKNGVEGQMTLEMVQTMAEGDTLYRQGKKKRKQSGRSILVRAGYAERLIKLLESCDKPLLEWKKECQEYCLVDKTDDFVTRLMRLFSVLSDYLEEQEEDKPVVRERLLEFYFRVSHFLDIYERLDENYVKYIRKEDECFFLKLFCVNPKENLKQCMQRGRSSILFSATFLPIQYYKRILGGEAEDYEVYARSVFKQEKRALYIAGDVTSRYTRRGDEEYYNIACYIDEIVKNRHGNYMVFFPSYSFMQCIYDCYMQHFCKGEKECILQQEYMSEQEREAFLSCFLGEKEEHILIGFCVLGGIFGEGIDLKGDSLLGVIVVGTGIPQVCCEREILKNHFDAQGENGFDYAYRYPGMNKVLQAAGRVIRTVEDVGVIALLDERFLQFSYQKMFPREWEEFETVSIHTVAKRVERFWDSWL